MENSSAQNNINLRLACFDVDGTLTFTDSFLLFLRFCSGRTKFLLNMVGLAPIFALYGIRLISRDAAKNHLLSAFLRDMSQSQYIETCEKFAQIIYPIIVRNDGLLRIKTHQGVGDMAILVSASLEDYLKPWAKNIGVETVIATKMEVVNGRLTGKMAGHNCRAQEKVNRIRNLFGDAQIIAAYGDSRGDKEMLEAATSPFYRTLIEEPRNPRKIINDLFWGNGFTKASQNQ